MSATRKCPKTNSGKHQWVATSQKTRVIGGTIFYYTFSECAACGDNKMDIDKGGRVKGKG